MKRIADLLLKALAVCSLLLIPAGFIFSGSFLTGVLRSVLGLKVDPRFTGGTEMAVFRDPAGDDNGDGGLTYPKGRRFPSKGTFDLLKYVVYSPMLDAAWSAQSEYWQLGVTLARFDNPDGAPNGFSLCSIRIYIDTDSAASGSTETAAPRAELVSFDPSAPWDVMVAIDGWHANAVMRTADGRAPRQVPIISVPERKTVYVRLPLDAPEVKRILDGRQTRHYVLICGYDPSSEDGVIQVKERATLSAGGGAKSELTPRVFDLLAASSDDQKRQLSSYDDATFRYAVLHPIVADPHARTVAPAVDLEALQAEAQRQGEADRQAAAARSAVEALSKDPLRAGPALFQSGKLEEAERSFRSVRDHQPDNPIAMAYLGSIAAMKGGRSASPAAAVRGVNDAFALLDRAEALAKSPADREVVLINRASVGAAVPESVFQKNLTAGRDFLEAADIAEVRGDERLAADRRISAGLCFERAANQADAETAFSRAAAAKELSAVAKIELAKRGFAGGGK